MENLCLELHLAFIQLEDAIPPLSETAKGFPRHFFIYMYAYP